MMNQRHIIFDKYLTVDNGYGVIPSPDSTLKKYPDIYDRICSIIYLATKINSKPDLHVISQKALGETMIRSALCEFVSLEDYIQTIYPNADKSKYLLYNTSDPIFHMLKLLRNYNIHISTSELEEKVMEVCFPNFPEETLEIPIPYISNLCLDVMHSVRDARYYSDSVLSGMIECFELVQHKFGVDTLIIKAGLVYSARLQKIFDERN